MRTLRLALQATLLYIAIAVLTGMAREPRHGAIAWLAVAAFFAGLLLLTTFFERLARAVTQSDRAPLRAAVAATMAVPAIASMLLAHGVQQGTWRGPSRMAGIHGLAVQFAGAWSLVLMLVLLAGLCGVTAVRVMRGGDN